MSRCFAGCLVQARNHCSTDAPTAGVEPPSQTLAPGVVFCTVGLLSAVRSRGVLSLVIFRGLRPHNIPSRKLSRDLKKSSLSPSQMCVCVYLLHRTLPRNPALSSYAIKRSHPTLSKSQRYLLYYENLRSDQTRQRVCLCLCWFVSVSVSMFVFVFVVVFVLMFV